MTLPVKWLTVDPGEDTGYAVWSGEDFVCHGTEKMWDFSDAVWAECIRQLTGADDIDPQAAASVSAYIAREIRDVSLIVLENWALYPWVLKTGAMDWDECRTARLIGSLYEACRIGAWGYEQQGALIKERAVAAGAEELFSHPLRENRHANDATMHGVYRIAKENNAKWTDLSTTSWVEPA